MGNKRVPLLHIAAKAGGLLFISIKKSGLFSGPESNATDGLRFQFHYLLAAETITCLYDIFLGDSTEQEGIVGNRRLRHDTLGHAFDDTLLNQVVQPASVAEILIALGGGFHNQGIQFLVRFGSQLEIAFLQETVCHFHQLVRIVIVKVELERETFLQAGVGTEHLLHLVLVASQDDNHVGIGF